MAECWRTAITRNHRGGVQTATSRGTKKDGEIMGGIEIINNAVINCIKFIACNYPYLVLIGASDAKLRPQPIQ